MHHSAIDTSFVLYSLFIIAISSSIVKTRSYIRSAGKRSIGHNNLVTNLYNMIKCIFILPFIGVPCWGWIIRKGNALSHKAGILSRWFEEHDREFTLLTWNAQSPDLKSVENLWDQMERIIRQLELAALNLKEVESVINRIWSQFPHTIYKHQTESMQEDSMQY